MATRKIVPRADNEGGLGTAAKKWASVHATLVNALTLASQSVGFTIAGGTTSKTLTVPLDASVSGTNTGDQSFSSPAAFGETAPNTIRGLNKEVFRTANADGALTAAEVSGTLISNYGMTDADCAIDLPACAAGLGFMLILPAVRARYFKLRAASTDKIYLSGTAGSDNGYVGVASGYATGASASFISFKASDGGYDWFVIPLFGTWVAS